MVFAADWLPSTPDSHEPLARLRNLLVLRSPPPGEVLAASEQLLGQMRAVRVNRPLVALPERLSHFMFRLATCDLPEKGWMEAGQWSLATTACVNAYRESAERQDRSLEVPVADCESRLAALQKTLAFRQSPVEETDADTLEAVAFDSPWTFDPTEHGYRRLVAEIREDLIKLANAATQQNPKAKR